MANEYYLRDYALTQEPDDFIAVIVSRGTTDLKELAQEMVQQGSSLTVEDIQDIFGEIQRAARALLDQGYRVDGPLSIIGPNIQGVFYGVGDAYDPQRHEAHLTAVPNPQFEEEWQATATFNKVKTVENNPVISSDRRESRNLQITPAIADGDSSTPFGRSE